MSESYETTGPSGSDVQSPDAPRKVGAAKQEAADLKDTATSEAKDVLETAKDEASTVVDDVKVQVKDLFTQTQQELRGQASTQQQRIASGLRSVGDDLGSMAANSSGGGVASDLVQQVSNRLSSASSWLEERDPGSVVTEVKRFARRKPGTFIIAAAVAGIIVGRLTRALASNAAADKSHVSRPALPPAPAVVPVPAPELRHPDQRTAVPVGTTQAGDADAPLHAQTSSTQPGIHEGDGDDRPDTV